MKVIIFFLALQGCVSWLPKPKPRAVEATKEKDKEEKTTKTDKVDRVFITRKHIQFAHSSCKNNSGIKIIYIKPESVVECQNGGRFWFK